MNPHISHLGEEYITMDTRFYNFTQTIRDVKRAEHTQQRFSNEVTGVGKTQDQVSIAGSKPDAMKIIKPTYARPVGFSGEVPLGSARGRHISASADAPKQKKKRRSKQLRHSPKYSRIELNVRLTVCSRPKLYKAWDRGKTRSKRRSQCRFHPSVCLGRSCFP